MHATTSVSTVVHGSSAAVMTTMGALILSCGTITVLFELLE